MNENLLKDLLFSLRDSTTNEGYGRGIFIGAITGLMAGGMGFGEALQTVCRNLPKDYRGEFIPEGYRFTVHKMVGD